MIASLLRARICILGIIVFLSACASTGESSNYGVMLAEGDWVEVDQATHDAHQACFGRIPDCDDLLELAAAGNQVARYAVVSQIWIDRLATMQGRRGRLGITVSDDDVRFGSEQMELLAEEGFPTAQAYIGLAMLDEAMGEPSIAVDPERGLVFLDAASDAGSAAAARNLGLAYLNGYGVDPDPEQAVTMLELAVERGHPTAGYILASMSVEQEGIGFDTAYITRNLVVSAERGNQLSAVALCNGRLIASDLEWEPVLEPEDIAFWCDRAQEMLDAAIERAAAIQNRQN